MHKHQHLTGALPLVAAFTLGLTACSGPSLLSNVGSTYNAVPPPHAYVQTTFAIPNVPVAAPGLTFSFDIGFVDRGAALYYLADRTNAGVDIFDARTNAFITTITGGFAGNTGKSSTSGPNGLALVSPTKMYAGDAKDSVKVLNLQTGTVTKTISLGGTGRADEGAYDPDDGIALWASDQSVPPLLSFINTTTDSLIGTMPRPDATGMEAALYIPALHRFIQAVPKTTANKNGELDLIDPVAQVITAVFPLPGACAPTGLAISPNLVVAVACGDPSATYLMDARNGNVLAQINQAGGGDEVAYDPTTNRFYVANSNNTSDGTKTGIPNPVLTIIDASTLFFIQNIPSEVGAHSVDSYAGKVFEPRRSSGLTVIQ